MPTITIPHAFDPRPYQVDFLAAPQRFKVAVWNRRAGKSKVALNQQVCRAMLKKGIYYYFLPTYKQAKAVIWDSLIREHVPEEIVDKRNDSELAVYYRNGSIHRFVGCEEPDAHRGINPIDVVFDEYSEMDERIWTEIVQPVLRENGGTATFVATPKGRNHLWRLMEQGKRSPEWFVSHLTVADTKSHSDAELEESRRNMPEALFAQEMMCSFEEGAGQVFRGVRECLYDPLEAPVSPQDGFEYQLGIDLAKTQDWTVITPFCLNTFRVGTQDRFNQVDWNLQKARIEAAHYRWNRAKVLLDSTGVGDPIAEDLERAGIDLGVMRQDRETVGFKFTESSRKQLLENLSMLFEQRRIRIPDDPGLIAELESFSFRIGERGRIRMEAPEGATDDRVMSLALSVWGIPENPYGKLKKDVPDMNYDRYSLI